MSWITDITDAVTAIGPRRHGYTAAELAAEAGISRQEMTINLARFREEQRGWSPTPPIYLACEGYGPGARWLVLAADDPAYVGKPIAEHAKYVVFDAIARYYRDLLWELEPGLVRRSKKVDRLVLAAVQQAADQMEAIGRGLTKALRVESAPVETEASLAELKAAKT